MKKKSKPIPTPKGKRVFTVRLDQSSIDTLREIAEERGANGISYLIRTIIKRFLANPSNKNSL